MSENARKFVSNTRLLGSTEQNWCKAVASGTGITALALQVSKNLNITLLKNALHKIQNNHPVLNSMLHKNTTTGSTSFIINPDSNHSIHLNTISLATTTQLLRTLASHGSNASLSPLHLILEHELNINAWSGAAYTRTLCTEGLYLWFATLYTLPDQKWIMVLRLHTAICDRATAVLLLNELREVMGEGEGYKEEGNMGLEELMPVGKDKKTLWEHGKDMFTYSVNTFRLKNLKFQNVKGPMHSEVVRLKMNTQETQMLLDVS